MISNLDNSYLFPVNLLVSQNQHFYPIFLPVRNFKTFIIRYISLKLFEKKKIF